MLQGEGRGLNEKDTINAFPLENHQEKVEVCLSSAVYISIFNLLLLVMFVLTSFKGIFFPFAFVVTHVTFNMFWQS